MDATGDLFCWKSAVTCFLAGLTLALVGCSGSTPPPSVPGTQPGNPVGANLTQVSSDPYSTGPGQHATEVEPHMVANGKTMVAAFQTGRIAPGGATNIGWATSTDGGNTWTHGFLPGLTTGEGSGPYDAASDPVVAYDAKHAVWLIASLPLSSTLHTPAVVVSRSSDGLTWQNPVSVDPSAPSSDKNWIACDSWASSPHFGNCYLEWDDPINQGEIQMSTSTDGGLTWEYQCLHSRLNPGYRRTASGSAEWERSRAGRDQCYLGFQFERRRHYLERCCNHFDQAVSHRRRWDSQWSAALRGSGWRWNRLGGVGGLPVPGHVRDERSCVQHVDRWRELERGYARTHRRHFEYGRLLHSWNWD